MLRKMFRVTALGLNSEMISELWFNTFKASYVFPESDMKTTRNILVDACLLPLSGGHNTF